MGIFREKAVIEKGENSERTNQKYQDIFTLCDGLFYGASGGLRRYPGRCVTVFF